MPRYYVLSEFPLDVGPDLANLEVRVHLDDLDLLLLRGEELVLVEARSVENREHLRAQVVPLNFLLYLADEVGLRAGVRLGVSGDQRLLESREPLRAVTKYLAQ